MTDYEKTPFSEQTIFNFQNSLSKHMAETGTNLLEQVFDGLTGEQLRTIGIKTNLQRGDSFLAGSNIRQLSRLQLLVEVTIRFYRELNDEDKLALKERFARYTKHSSNQFLYRLKLGEVPHELSAIGELYHFIITDLKTSYGDLAVFDVLQRVYDEHFSLIDSKIEVNPPEKLNSSMLQSPDDLDATYRQKRDEKGKGQVIHVSETANPDNPIQLITYVAVEANNVDDSKILNDRLDIMKEKTPDLKEYHQNGGYGSVENDIKMKELGIYSIQTAIRGRQPASLMRIEEIEDGELKVFYPEGKEAVGELCKTRYKAVFDVDGRIDCKSFNNGCRAGKTTNRVVYRFGKDDVLKSKRRQVISKLPIERQYLKPNVEATVQEMKLDIPRNLVIKAFLRIFCC